MYSAANIQHRLSIWVYLSVFIIGAITVLAFAPFKLYPLAWLAPAFLFFILSKAQTKKQYLYLGWVYGIGFFGVGASWPFYSLYFYSHAPLFIALLGTSLFVVIVAFFSTGLFGLLASLFRKRALFSRLLLFFPASWVLLEWFRSWFLTGFPWLYLGNTQIDSLFASYAPVLGVLGVSYICVLISSALLCFYLGNSILRTVYIEPDPHNKTVSNKAISEEHFGPSVRMFSALIVVALVAGAFLLQNIHWTEKVGKPQLVSVLQSNISQTEKLNNDSLMPSIALYQAMTKESRESDLIVWPETALFDSFDRHMTNLIEPLQRSLQGTKKAILLGGFYLNDEKGIENSVLAITADSRSIYSKKHLVPFGEYTPFLKYLRWLDKWIQLPYDNISAGEFSSLLDINGYKAQMTICYEDAFGAEMIEVLPEASLLINVTHDGWFTGSLEPAQHMQIARMRALETGRYLVRSTTTGPAGIINEKGKVLATANPYTKKVITHKVQHFSGATPYVLWGNWLIVSILSLILIIGIFWKKAE